MLKPSYLKQFPHFKYSLRKNCMITSVIFIASLSEPTGVMCACLYYCHSLFLFYCRTCNFCILDNLSFCVWQLPNRSCFSDFICLIFNYCISLGKYHLQKPLVILSSCHCSNLLLCRVFSICFLSVWNVWVASNMHCEYGNKMCKYVLCW